MRKMWSKNQIIKNLESENIKVKTIEQSEANRKVDLESLPMEYIAEGLTYSPIYAKFEEINGVLYLALTFKISNESESSLTPGNTAINIPNFPKYLGERIFDLDGKKVSEAPANILSSQISADIGFGSDNSYPQFINRMSFKCILEHSGENSIRLNFFDFQSVEAGKTLLYSFRTFLTIL